MFTRNELISILELVTRAPLKDGNEARVSVTLQDKIVAEVQALDAAAQEAAAQEAAAQEAATSAKKDALE